MTTDDGWWWWWWCSRFPPKIFFSAPPSIQTRNSIFVHSTICYEISDNLFLDLQSFSFSGIFSSTRNFFYFSRFLFSLILLKQSILAQVEHEHISRLVFQDSLEKEKANWYPGMHATTEEKCLKDFSQLFSLASEFRAD